MKYLSLINNFLFINSTIVIYWIRFRFFSFSNEYSNATFEMSFSNLFLLSTFIRISWNSLLLRTFSKRIKLFFYFYSNLRSIWILQNSISKNTLNCFENISTISIIFFSLNQHLKLLISRKKIFDYFNYLNDNIDKNLL